MHWNGLPKVAKFWMGIVVILCIGLGRYFRYEQVQIDKQFKHDQGVLKVAKSQYNEKYERLKIQANHQYLVNRRNRKGVEGENAKQMIVVNKMRDLSEGLFGLIYNYDPSTDFNAHKQQAGKYVTQQVIDGNPAIFTTGKDLTGGNEAEALDVTNWLDGVKVYGTSVNQDGSVNGIVRVTYSEREGSHTPGRSTLLYSVSYNPKVKRLTALKQLGFLSTESEGSGDYHNELPNR